MSQLQDAIARRRTFAIISHPDAGKTTLTEKLLLFGGAIQAAGAVKARGEMRRTRSDWMKVEQERGISVSASVLTFDYQDHTFNLLDTPGHEDFSEDTYRTLTAVDSAVMVIDAAKGIEAQTRKLFEVCRLRDVPILTFVNKLDREARDPFELLDEIHETLALDVTPASWPIGMGQRFQGCYDLFRKGVSFYDRSHKTRAGEEEFQPGLDAPQLAERLGDKAYEQLLEEVEMARELCPDFDVDSYLEGHLTPVLFGTALHSFGVRELLSALGRLAPAPRPRPAQERTVEPDEKKVSGFVFKIQANMDPRHRDRLAFCRLCSGKFERGMKLFQPRTGKTFAVRNSVLFLAQDRELAEEAYAGDIIGIPNYGQLRIGDTLTEGEALSFTGIPSFAPEFLKKVRTQDPLRAKHLEKALLQLAEEGAAQVFKSRFGSQWIVGVAGALQFDVLADRIRTEYDIDVIFEAAHVHTARWVEADDPKQLKAFLKDNDAAIANDHNGAPVLMARNPWHLTQSQEDWPDIKFLTTREQAV